MNVVSNPTIINAVLQDANTEVEIELPLGVLQFSVQARTAVALLLSYAQFDTGRCYRTVKSGAVYSESNLVGNIRKLYVQASTAGTVVEVVAWA